MLETKGEKGVGLASLVFLRGFKIKKKCLFFLVREFYILCSYFFQDCILVFILKLNHVFSQASMLISFKETVCAVFCCDGKAQRDENKTTHSHTPLLLCKCGVVHSHLCLTCCDVSCAM